MKRFIIAAAIAISVFVSCSEPNEGNPVLEEKHITIKAFGENAVTRTTRDSDGKILWSPNEAISLFYHTGTDGGSKFISVNEAKAAQTDFSGVISVMSGVIEGGVANPRYFYGIYPYNTENSVDADGKIVTVVRDNQDGVPNTFADGHYVSIGKSQGLEMGFYNLCGGFKFRLTREDVTKVTLKGNNGEILAGKVKVVVGDDNVPLVDEIIDGKTELVMTCPEGSVFQTGVDYFFVILPQTLSKGLTFTMETAGGLVGERVVEVSVDIPRSYFSYSDSPVDTGVEYGLSGNIVFAYPVIKEACVRNWDTDGDGELSYAEAAAVTSLGSTFSEKVWWTNDVSFDEFQYFTGITELKHKNAFEGADKITSITLPNSLTSIGIAAFKGCDKLTHIVIPSSVTEIDINAFSGCSGLTSIDVPESVTTIGSGAFRGCSGLTSIVIPSSVTTIESGTFENCAGLTSIEIPDAVTSIKYRAFYGCSKLSSIDIPDSVTTIGQYAFYGCSSLASIIIPGSVTTIDEHTFSGCTSLTSVDIPSSVTTIGISAFSGCTGLASIEIPSSVTTIQSFAFRDCSSLTSIDIPDSVTSIGSYTFFKCSSLSSIEIPRTITVLSDHLFDGCSSLAEVQLPSTITNIGANCFQSCSSLTQIIIPDSVTSIGDEAFIYAGLKSIRIPSGVVSIGTNTFYSCTELTGAVLPEGLKTIGDSAFGYCGKLTQINLPESLTTIGRAAFKYCSLTNVNIPENVTSISEDAFSQFECSIESFSGKFASSDGNCIIVDNVLIALVLDGLSSYRIPDGVTRIGEGIYVKYDLTIPASVTTIGQHFGVKGNLTVLASEPPIFDTVYNSNLSYSNSDYIYVPYNSVDAYKTADIWSKHASQIKPLEVPQVSFNDSAVKSICVANWDTNQDGELSVTEMAAVTTLGDVFMNNTSITSFDEFRYFTGLTSLYDSFSRCTNLTSITLPESVKTISGAFYHCSSLVTVNLPSGLQTIGTYSFVSCTSLKSVTIPASVTSIGSNAFASCTGLEQIVLLPTTPPTFSESCFYNVNCPIYVPKGTLDAYKEAGMGKIPVGLLVEMTQ